MKKLLLSLFTVLALFGFVVSNHSYAQPVIQLGTGEEAPVYDLNTISSQDLKKSILSTEGTIEIWCDNPEEVSDFEDKFKEALKDENVFIVYHKKYYYDDGTSYFKIEVLDGDSDEAQERREDLQRSFDRVLNSLAIVKSLRDI